MKSINMTEEGLNAMKPSQTGSVQQLFGEDEAESEKTNKKLSKVDAFEVQKDIVHYLEINDMLVQWLSS